MNAARLQKMHLRLAACMLLGSKRLRQYASLADTVTNQFTPVSQGQ
jgi:hypothetical protein